MEQWEGNFPCDNHYEIKIDFQSKYFPNINQFRVFKRVAYLSRDNLYEISKYLHRIIFQSDIGAETGNSLYIYYTKLPMLAQLPSFLKRRKRRGGKKKHVINLTTERQHRFNFAEFRPTTRHGLALSRRYCRSFPGN